MTAKEFNDYLDQMTKESGFDFHKVQKTWAYQAAKGYHQEKLKEAEEHFSRVIITHDYAGMNRSRGWEEVFNFLKEKP